MTGYGRLGEEIVCADSSAQAMLDTTVRVIGEEWVPMVRLETTLVSMDGLVATNTSATFEQDEWDTLRGFHENCEKLRSTRFVQQRRGGEISVSLKAGASIASTAKRVKNDDEVWSMLHKLRPFVLQNERYYFHRVRKLLSRRLCHAAFRNHLDLLVDGFELRNMNQRVRLRGPGRPPLSVDVVMDWLNSFEYHRDEEKRERVRIDLGIFGDDQNGLPIVLFALVDMVQSILDMGAFIETIMEVASGARREIRCPAEWLTENRSS